MKKHDIYVFSMIFLLGANFKKRNWQREKDTQKVSFLRLL